MAIFEWVGYDVLQVHLAGLADPDPTPLLEEWQDIIENDNARGVLAGLDKDGNPMDAVTYRPVGAVTKVTKRQRNNTRAGTAGVFSGLGQAAAGLNNNLTRAEYLTLGGPPLAPRGASSRVITNLLTSHGYDADLGQWYADGAWFEVVSVAGVPFLEAHFLGLNVGRGLAVKLPRRDLTGVRPQGRMEAVAALERWAEKWLKGA